jgi:hypothetical protein
MLSACPHSSLFFLNSNAIRAKNELSGNSLSHLKHDGYLYCEPKLQFKRKMEQNFRKLNSMRLIRKLFLLSLFSLLSSMGYSQKLEFEYGLNYMTYNAKNASLLRSPTMAHAQFKSISFSLDKGQNEWAIGLLKTFHSTNFRVRLPSWPSDLSSYLGRSVFAVSLGYGRRVLTKRPVSVIISGQLQVLYVDDSLGYGFPAFSDGVHAFSVVSPETVMWLYAGVPKLAVRYTCTKKVEIYTTIGYRFLNKTFSKTQYEIVRWADHKIIESGTGSTKGNGMQLSVGIQYCFARSKKK